MCIYIYFFIFVKIYIYIHIGLPFNDINCISNNITKVHDKWINRTDKYTSRWHTHTHVQPYMKYDIQYTCQYIYMCITSLVINGIYSRIYTKNAPVKKLIPCSRSLPPLCFRWVWPEMGQVNHPFSAMVDIKVNHPFIAMENRWAILPKWMIYQYFKWFDKSMVYRTKRAISQFANF